MSTHLTSQEFWFLARYLGLLSVACLAILTGGGLGALSVRMLRDYAPAHLALGLAGLGLLAIAGGWRYLFDELKTLQYALAASVSTIGWAGLLLIARMFLAPVVLAIIGYFATDWVLKKNKVSF